MQPNSRTLISRNKREGWYCGWRHSQDGKGYRHRRSVDQWYSLKEQSKYFVPFYKGSRDK